MLACIKVNGTDKVRAFAVDLNEYAEFGMQEDDASRTKLGSLYFWSYS